jgi:LysM repeat protein
MRAWKKSACVVLAWIIVSILVVTAGMHGSIGLAQASTRTISSPTETHRPSAPTVSASPATTTSKRTYVVRDGDSLSEIALRLAVRGGWPALYAANRQIIGPDPNLIRAGTLLAVPVGRPPIRYTVVAGDTLSGIAAAFTVRGGWRALYTANRQVIGADPDDVRAGTVLAIAARPALSRPAPGGTSPQTPPRPPSRPTVRRHEHWPTSSRAAAEAGVPSWLVLLLLAVGLLIVAAVATVLVRAAARQRQMARALPRGWAVPAAVRASDQGTVPTIEQSSEGSTGIIFIDHDQLIITRNPGDDSICVLRPPDQDPKAILRVARLVLPERRYGELAERLGLPARWPME